MKRKETGYRRARLSRKINRERSNARERKRERENNLETQRKW